MDLLSRADEKYNSGLFDFGRDTITPSLSLDENFRCGDSLMGMDYYDNEIDFGWDRKLKPFSWEKAFPKVFTHEGFDVVIGNPPYVRQELLGELKSYSQKTYKVYHGVADPYAYFMEKGLGLLNPSGLFGIIVANKWMRAGYGQPLRSWLKTKDIKEIIDFGDLQVFKGATTYPCIFI
jgi:type II restriction/modification system DNA methylase subunit YeeA